MRPLLPGVEHQDHEAHDEGGDEFGVARPGEGDEAEGAAEDAGDDAHEVAGARALDAQQVDAGVEVREHREENRDAGEHPEEVGGLPVRGHRVDGREDEHEDGHLDGGEDEAVARDPVLVEFAVDLREVAVLGGAGAGLRDEHHPGAERGEAGERGEGGDDGRGPVAHHRRGAHREGRARGGHHVRREHAGDHLRGEDVDRTREARAQHGGERNGALRVVDETRRDGGRFDANEGPEAEEHALDDGAHVGRAGRVPVLEVELRVEPEPARKGRAHDGNQHRDEAERRELGDPAAAQHVDQREDPDDGDAGQARGHRAVEDREEDGEVRDGGDADREVADPVGVVVEHARLEAEDLAHFARVGDRAALLRVDGRETRIDVGERKGADERDDPPEDGDGAEPGQVGGQEGDAGTHHVPGDDAGTCDETDFLS